MYQFFINNRTKGSSATSFEVTSLGFIIEWIIFAAIR